MSVRDLKNHAGEMSVCDVSQMRSTFSAAGEHSLSYLSCCMQK